jgi:hypothetical protein
MPKIDKLEPSLAKLRMLMELPHWKQSRMLIDDPMRAAP